MGNDHFFDESKDQSIVKATIVSKYFQAWAQVVIPSTKQWAARNGDTPRIAYIDLFAGPGRYKDGTKSTPLRILETAIAGGDLQQMLVTIFNDVDSNNTQTLENEINKLPGVATLKHKPQVNNQEVGSEIVEMFESMSMIPTLFFVDPWGYKGLSLRLINSVLRNWGCDCVFFFNYNRINMGVRNPIVKDHMNALFGEERAEALRIRLGTMTPRDRELTVVEEVSQALKDMGGNYVVPFCFKNEHGKRTSHYLMFVSKHFRGYEIMKQIMAKESSTQQQGVASFDYVPADARYQMLFEFSRPLDDLGDLIREEFAGQILTMLEIYEKHNVGRPYVKKNYKEVLLQLDTEGRIQASPSAASRRSNTFADHVKVTFPRRR